MRSNRRLNEMVCSSFAMQPLLMLRLSARLRLRRCLQFCNATTPSSVMWAQSSRYKDLSDTQCCAIACKHLLGSTIRPSQYWFVLLLLPPQVRRYSYRSVRFGDRLRFRCVHNRPHCFERPTNGRSSKLPEPMSVNLNHTRAKHKAIVSISTSSQANRLSNSTIKDAIFAVNGLRSEANDVLRDVTQATKLQQRRSRDTRP